MKSENTDRVRRVIAIEEHAWTPKLREALLHSGDDETVARWSDEATTNRRLLDIGEERLARMDEMGVDFQVLSITAPGVQQLPASLAVALARDANDYLANAVQRQPDRFAAFATLPTPDPTAAADELRRCVGELGFVGAMAFPRTVLILSITNASGQFSWLPQSWTCPYTSIPACRLVSCAMRATAALVR